MLPYSFHVFASLCTMRVLTALLMPVLDCDETYNYWEPLHFSLYKTGLQTWEYSPEYALRSWLYILLHHLLALPAYLVGFSKPNVFYWVRCILACSSAYTEATLHDAVRKRFGPETATIYGYITAVSTGLCIASVSFLPSSFSMMCHTYAMAAWLLYDRRRPKYMDYTVGAVVVGAVVGWPFGALCMIPAALDTLVVYGLGNPIKSAVFSLVSISSLVIAVDTFYYCRPVFSTLNIIIYNVLPQGDGRGSHLYGVEPLSFFFRNLLLNFNVIFPLAAVSPVLMWLEKGYTKRQVFYVFPFFLWFGFWCAIPHKEERFMFPCYPALCVAGAIATRCVALLVHRRAASVVLVLFLFGSVTRTIGLHFSYGAPMAVQHALYNNIHKVEPLLHDLRPSSDGLRAPQRPTFNVCYGKEWFRYPSAFFLNENTPYADYKFQFIRSKFRGQLPAPFGGSTCRNGGAYNDLNREDISRYVDVTQCDLLIDSDFQDQREKRYFLDQGHWVVLKEVPILDAGRSPWWARAFYLPKISQQSNVWGRYFILKRQRRGASRNPLGDLAGYPTLTAVM